MFLFLFENRLSCAICRDLVNFSKRRERWKHHLGQVDLEIMEQYEQRMQHGDACLCRFSLQTAFDSCCLLTISRSAAILAPPVSDNEPALDIAIAECDYSAAESEFLPRKREKGQSIWFDVPNRGGIGMIHVAKRKCPEIMFKYWDHLSKEQGRKGWCFPSQEDNKMLSPAKVTPFFFFLIMEACCCRLTPDALVNVCL